MTHLLAPWLSRWAEHSQQRACRNAMVASTALAQARHERAEVEAYVAEAIAHRSDATGPTVPQQPGAATGS